MNSISKTNKNTKAYVLILVSIIILGAFLRFAGTDFALPIKTHPDEQIITYEAARMAGERSFETKVYYRPNHTSIKANALIYMLIDDVKYNSENAEVFQENFNNNISIFYLASRLLSALLSTMCIFIVYIIGKQVDSRVGLLAAGLFAVFPSFVVHAHYVTPESMQVFFLLLISLFAILYIKKPSLFYLGFMSIVAAFAICEKYPSGYFCITIAFSIICVHYKKLKMLLKRAFLAAVIYIGSIFLISPVLFLDYRAVYEAIKKENHAIHPGADGLDTVGNFLYYFKTYYAQVGIIFFILAIVGVYCCIKKHRDIGIVLLIGCLYITPLAFTNLHWERWGVPTYAHILIFSAIGMFYTFKFLHDKIVQSNFQPNMIKVLLGIVITFVLILPFVSVFSSAIARTLGFMVRNTQTDAVEYCIQNGITEENSYFEGYTPLLPTGSKTIFDLFEDYDITKPRNKDENITYVLISSGTYERYYMERERYNKEVKFYESLKEKGQVKKVFMPTTSGITELIETDSILGKPPIILSYVTGGEAFTPTTSGISSPIEISNILMNFFVISKYMTGGEEGNTLIIYER